MANLGVNVFTVLAASATAGSHTVTNSATAKQVYVQVIRSGVVVDGKKIPFSGQFTVTCQAGDVVQACPVGGTGTATVAFV